MVFWKSQVACHPQRLVCYEPLIQYEQEQKIQFHKGKCKRMQMAQLCVMLLRK